MMSWWRSIYRTRDGRTWTATAGIARGLIQRIDDLYDRDNVTAALRTKPHEGHTRGIADHLHEPRRPGTAIRRIPVVQATDGTTRLPVGPPAETEPLRSTDYVVLKPRRRAN